MGHGRVKLAALFSTLSWLWDRTCYALLCQKPRNERASTRDVPYMERTSFAIRCGLARRLTTMPAAPAEDQESPISTNALGLLV